VTGPTLRFNTATNIAIVGAPALVMLNGVAVEMNRSFQVNAGDLLKIGRFETVPVRVPIWRLLVESNHRNISAVVRHLLWVNSADPSVVPCFPEMCWASGVGTLLSPQETAQECPFTSK
jgi:hypothetical protein